VARELLEFLFDGIRGNPAWPIAETFKLTGAQYADGGSVTNETSFELSRGDHSLYRGPSSGVAAGILLNQAIHALADPCSEGLMLHAAAVARLDRGVLLPAVSGSGKTTSAACFTASGFDYLTDELVFINKASARLCAFCRPLHLKTPAIGTMERITGLALRDDPSRGAPAGVLRSREGVLISARLLNRDTRYSTPAVKLIVFPKYRAGAPLDLRRLSKAEAAMHLMESLVNARNLTRHGLDEVTRLVRQAPAYGVTYGQVEESQAAIRSLIDQPAADSADVGVWP
jgi:hypothetical protein